jgi:hypothetical protein
MACCVLAALIISQVVLAWERCRSWLGLGRSVITVSAAEWRPGMAAASAAPVATSSPLPRRLALVLVLQLSLGVLLGLHWSHLGAEMRAAGTFLGLVDAPDPALCNVR